MPYPGHDIVASFKLEKPISVLEDNIAQLEADILDEIEVPSTKVVVLSLEDSFGSNVTDVIFGVDSESKYSSLSSTTQSLIQASFRVSELIYQPYKFKRSTVAPPATVQDICSAGCWDYSLQAEAEAHSLGESPAPASAPITHSSPSPIPPPPPRTRSCPPLSVKGPAPKISATPPVKSGARPPGCRFGLKGQQRGKTPEASSVAPAAAPKISPHFSIPPPHPQGNHRHLLFIRFLLLVLFRMLFLPNVHPPSVSEADPEPPDRSQPFAPSPSPCEY
ncbi:hypothetical protein Ancab_013941 [Ancistrocladus abbreviatus]